VSHPGAGELKGEQNRKDHKKARKSSDLSGFGIKKKKIKGKPPEETGDTQWKNKCQVGQFAVGVGDWNTKRNRCEREGALHPDGKRRE